MKSIKVLLIFLMSMSSFAKEGDGINVNELSSPSVAVAKETKGLAKSLDTFEEDVKDIAAFGCEGARNGDFATFQKKLDNANLEFPNFSVYSRASCGNGNFILQEILVSDSTSFLRKFISESYKKYKDKEDIKKIINLPSSRFHFTLLEEAILLNKCAEDKGNTTLTAMITFLKRIGGEKRSNFIKLCNTYL